MNACNLVSRVISLSVLAPMPLTAQVARGARSCTAEESGHPIVLCSIPSKYSRQGACVPSQPVGEDLVCGLQVLFARSAPHV
jgi:hypothetical protein